MRNFQAQLIYFLSPSVPIIACASVQNSRVIVKTIPIRVHLRMKFLICNHNIYDKVFSRFLDHFLLKTMDKNILSDSSMNVGLYRGAGSGCAGCAIAHPLFRQMAFFISFQRRKEFWKSVKNLPRWGQKCKLHTHFL